MRTIKKVGIVIKPHAPQVDELLRSLLAYFGERRIDCVLEETAARKLGRRDGLARADVPGASDFVVVLGGNGTLLSVAYCAAQAGVPVMGINLGRLGFLTEIPVAEAFLALDAFLAGAPDTVSPRSLLEVTTEGGPAYCLNDVVITKGAVARMIEFTILIDGAAVATLKADGLIVSTPTGSTAYSLSAGGPIIHPQVPAVVLTPICPHTLTYRPLIIPSGSEVEIKLLTGGEEVYLTLDGQRGASLVRSDTVRIRKAPVELQLVTSPRRSYYDLVKEKLSWAE
ncbi:MAG TPA: NAD(+)/NADH kinase [Burkholderiales bacterium]|nr:NAD(+)/NADH kinase [Burkholderiales bacterium]